MRRVCSFAVLAALLMAAPLGLAEDKLWTELSEGADGDLAGPVPRAAFAELAETLSPAVVHIAVTRGAPGFLVEEGMGSGFIINPHGYVLTNNHVVESARKIRVILPGSDEYAATLVGADPRTDLALLKVDSAEPLPVAPLGDSDSLRIGEWVLAIGNPFGLDQTVTAGIVSAKGRKEVAPGREAMYANFIQTDASINPGNSGGPLINMRGEVVGINTAIQAGAQGIGFAIPVNMAKLLLPQLAEGKVERGYLGVLIQEVTREMSGTLGLKDASGALVAEVLAGSPADKAGVRVGDVIVEFAGKPIKDHVDLPWLAATAKVGSTVAVTVVRKKKPLLLKVVMGRLAESGATPGKHAAKKPSAVPGTGISVASLSEEDRKTAGLNPRIGVIIMAVNRGSDADRVGIRPGDIVLRVGYTTVGTPEKFEGECNKMKPGETVLLHVRRGARLMYVAFKKE